MKKKMIFKRMIAVAVFVVAIMSSCLFVFNAAAEDVITISGTTALRNIAVAVANGNTYEGKIISLKSDLTVANDVRDACMIGDSTHPFKGTFEGNGHTITVNFTSSAGYIGGVFGYIENATVRNLTVAGSVDGSGSYVGGIVGYANNSTIEYCTNKASVSKTVLNYLSLFGMPSYVGGICGCAGNSTVRLCANTGYIDGYLYAFSTGGIVGGGFSSQIINCTNNREVVSYNENVGGIAGILNNSSIYESLNSANINGIANVGGIAGQITDSSITFCSNVASISSARGSVGGIVGYIYSGYIYGVENSGYISYNEPDYLGIGGIAGKGENGWIDHAVNRGSVNGAKYAGGIVGTTYYGFSVNSCVNYGEIGIKSAGTGFAYGGIAGDAGGYVSFCANYGNVYGYQYVSGIADSNAVGDHIKFCISVCEVKGYSDDKYVAHVGEISGISPDAQAEGIYTNLLDHDRTVKALNRLLTDADKANGRGWGYDDKGNIVPILTNGFGSVRFPYSVTTADELALLSKLVNGGWKNNNTLCVSLDADIYDEESVISPIGREDANAPESFKYAFEGDFYGNGHTITLKMNVKGENSVGLFGMTHGSHISNLCVAGGIIGEKKVGGFVGNAVDTIFVNCQNDANVTGGEYVGGIAGLYRSTGKEKSRMLQCVNRGIVTATVNGGAGLAGEAEPYMANSDVVMFSRCLNSGEVICKGENSDAVFNRYGKENNPYNVKVNYQFVFYYKEMCSVKSKFAKTCELNKVPENMDNGFQIFPEDERAARGSPVYILRLCGKTMGFKTFSSKNDMPEAYFHGVEPDYENAGHKEYWYSYYDGVYYEDEYFGNTISANGLVSWTSLSSGHGYLKPFDKKTTYNIDGHLFKEAEDAENYLYKYGDDGIEYIFLAGDITTIYPVVINEGKTLTVELNGHKWTYSGKDDSAVFESKANSAHLIIIGADETKREKAKKKSILDVYKSEKDKKNMPTIEVPERYHCRLLIGKNITLETDYLYVYGTGTKGNGGMIYADGKVNISMDYTIIEKSLAMDKGGAIFIESPDRVSVINLTNTIFYNCESYNGGGAIYADAGLFVKGTATDMTVTESSGFISCHSLNGNGGAIWFNGLNEYDNRQNTGIRSDARNLFFDECYCGSYNSIDFMRYNQNPEINGGAIYISTDYCEINNCEFMYCLSQGGGGGICVVYSKYVNILNSDFSNCAAAINGQDILYNIYANGSVMNINISSVESMEKVSYDSNKRGRIAFLYYSSPNYLENVSFSNGAFYGSVLSGGSLIAIICGVVLVAAGTVFAVIYSKRKKKSVKAE